MLALYVYGRFIAVYFKGSGYSAGPGQIVPRGYSTGPGQIVPDYSVGPGRIAIMHL